MAAVDMTANQTLKFMHCASLIMQMSEQADKHAYMHANKLDVVEPTTIIPIVETTHRHTFAIHYSFAYISILFSA